MVVDISIVKKHIKPKADSTLRNMRKDDLIEYIRCLENNYNVAVSFNNQQAKNIDTMLINAFSAGCNWGYGVDLSADVSGQEMLGARQYIGEISEEEAFRKKNELIEEAENEKECLFCKNSMSADAMDGTAVLVCFDCKGYEGKEMQVDEVCENYKEN